MRRKLTWCVTCTATIVLAALHFGGRVHASPAAGYVSTTMAQGRFGEIDVSNYFIPPDLNTANVWLSWQKTKGMSDLYVQNNVWQPGGTTGWHTHPAASLIIVTAGTVTAYEGDDPNCTPTVYTQGIGFVDPGGGHVHILRNEGSVEARTIAVQLLPADSARRVDVDDPGNCHF